MKIDHFGLGLRFDLLSSPIDAKAEKNIFEEIFSVLTLPDVKGLRIWGGRDSTAQDGENIYLVVIEGGSLGEMRKIFRKLDDDAAISMYLSHNHPFIENNRLAHVEGLTFFGVPQSDGTLAGGERDCFSIVIPKKRGKKRPVGKGIKILIATDAFNDTLCSTEGIKRLTFAARRHFPGAKIVPVPIAGGGEGTVNAIVTAADGAYRSVRVSSPLGNKINAAYGVLHGKTAIIEMAAASGLMRVPEGERDIMRASSFGTGELIQRALDEGLKHIFIGLGDSAVNDCGMGCARALGVRFYDEAGNELTGSGADLIHVKRMDIEHLCPRAFDAKFTVMCDVNSPLLGPFGATRAHAAQKGATKDEIDELELGMQNFASVLSETFMRDISSKPGAGAGGGMGAMLHALLGAKMVSGIDALFDMIDFDTLLDGVALVVTGEGRLNESSVAYGKLVYCVAGRCARRKVPVAVITETVDGNIDKLYDICNAAVMTALNPSMPMPPSAPYTEALFNDAADRMFRLIRMGRDVEKIGAPKPKKR